MDLSTQWHLRQIGLSYLTSILSCTGVLTAWTLILFYKFSKYGLWMYPGLHIPAKFTIADALQIFWDQSLSGIAALVPLALLADILLKRFVWKTGE
jgi:glycopeptide antibiotics resistance protein